MLYWRTLSTAAVALSLAATGAGAADQAPDSGASLPHVSPLTGSAWQLVRIAAMDDSVAEPADRSRYTLVFHEDGRASMRADCNRGTASWRSEAPAQLVFGPVASTRALCPPPSISDLYLKQFQWVRSYVVEDGHLFLATMADGSLIEFEPVVVDGGAQ